MTDDLRERIDRLEREKRWWKRLATTALSALALLLILGAALGVFQYQRAAAQAAAEAQAQRDATHRAWETVRKVVENGQEKKR